MWCLETMKLVGEMSQELSRQGRPVREAVDMLCDPRRTAEVGRLVTSIQYHRWLDSTDVPFEA